MTVLLLTQATHFNKSLIGDSLDHILLVKYHLTHIYSANFPFFFYKCFKFKWGCKCKGGMTMADRLIYITNNIIHKFTVDYYYWLKRLNTQLNESTIQNSLKVPKV